MQKDSVSSGSLKRPKKKSLLRTVFMVGIVNCVLFLLLALAAETAATFYIQATYGHNSKLAEYLPISFKDRYQGPEPAPAPPKTSVIYKVPFAPDEKSMKPGVYPSVYGFDFRVNSLGFRGKEVDLDADPVPFRILCYGGSTTVGLESPDGQTWPEFLEQKLGKKGIEAEVINLGLSSKSMAHITSVIEADLDKYKPKMVVIYSNRNSTLYDGTHIWAYLGSLQGNPLAFYFERANQKFRDDVGLFYLAYKLKLAGMVRDEAPEQWSDTYARMYFSGKGEPIDFYQPFFEYGYKEKLAPAIKKSKENGITIILASQAFLFDRSLQQELQEEPIEKLIQRMRQDPGSMYMRNTEYVDAKVWMLTGAALNRQMSEIADENDNVEFADVSREFLNLPDRHKLFNDYMHLTPDGNAQIARIVGDKVLEIIETKKLSLGKAATKSKG